MKRKVYIFNATSRAAAYGVGTYIKQLTDSLKETDIDYGIIYLHSKESNEITITEEMGYKQISIPSVTSTVAGSAQYYQRNIAYLLKEFISEDKDIQYIFHLNFMTNPGLVSILKKMFKCKVITTVHYTNWSFALLGNQQKLQNILTKKTLNPREKSILKDIKADKEMLEKNDSFICVAQHTFDSFKDICGIDIVKGVLINNALEDSYTQLSHDEKTAIRQKYSISEQTKVIVFAGRLDEVKGLRFLISAYKEVLKTNPDIHLFIAGDGDFTGWLSVAKNDWIKITFTGKLDKEQLYELYSIADIGIVPSLHEEFGYVAIEMMMHETPIIVTDTGGLAEIVEDGISGLKVPVQNDGDKRIIDTAVMADKMRLLLDNRDYATELGRNGRLRFLEKYELGLFKEKMKNLYLNI
jgi:glycosyltransferase